MNARILSPSHDMIDTVIGELTHTEKDYRPNLVVFPGKRPAHHLRKRLAAMLGSAYLPPRILSADAFIDYLYTEILGERIQDITELDAAGILLELQDVLSHLLAGDKNRKLEAFLPFGLKLFQELEELKIGNISPSVVKTQIDAFLDLYNMPELLYLRDFYSAFYEEVSRRGITTRAMRYAAVAARSTEITLDDWQRVILAGYAIPNPSERVLFHRLATQENVRFLFQDTDNAPLAAEQFRELHPVSEAGAVVGEPQFRFYESSDTHGQLFALAALLKDMQENGIPMDERTVIVVSKPETLFPLLSYGIGHIPEQERNISLGYPFQRTPVYEFIMALMHAAASQVEGRYSAPDYLNYLLHPYTKNIYYGKRADVTRIVFHTIEEEFFTGASAAMFRIEDILSESRVFERAAERLVHLDIELTPDELRAHFQGIHNATLGALERAGTIGDVANTLAGILRFIFEQSTARLHPLVQPFIQTAINELDRIGESGIAPHTFGDMAAYERLMRRALSSLNEAFTGTPVHGLQILGLLETRNLKFDRVFILDANEDALPGGRGTDMLLPQRMRESFELETYRIRERRTGHYFHLLCQGAQEVHILYRTGNGMERSRFAEQLIWDMERGQGRTSLAGTVQTVQYNVSLQNRLPVGLAKTEAMMDKIHSLPLSASSIDTYLRCGLKFYYHYVLGLRRQDDISGEIESNEIGTIVHTVAERYFGSLTGRPLTFRDLDAGRMDALIEEVFRSEYGTQIEGELLLLRVQIQRRMREFLTEYQAKIIAKHSVTVLDLEESIQVEYNGVMLTGKLDRVENRDGQVYVIDYKTGGTLPSIRLNAFDPADRNGWSRVIGSVQLPMYVLLYSLKHQVSPEDIHPCYVHLGRAQLDGKTEVAIGKRDTVTTDWYPGMREVISSLIGEIHNAEIPFLPPDEPARACTYCEFKTVCGTRWI